MSNSLWPHGLQHFGLLCPPLSSRVCSDSYPLSRLCYLNILGKPDLTGLNSTRKFTQVSGCPQCINSWNPLFFSYKNRCLGFDRHTQVIIMHASLFTITPYSENQDKGWKDFSCMEFQIAIPIKSPLQYAGYPGKIKQSYYIIFF